MKYSKILRLIDGFAECSKPWLVRELQDIRALIEIITRNNDEFAPDMS
jgi:hypothetical protein